MGNSTLLYQDNTKYSTAEYRSHSTATFFTGRNFSKMECKVFPEKIYVTSSFISISIYIYKQTGNLQINDLFKTSGKNTIRIEGEGGRGVFSEAKPVTPNRSRGRSRAGASGHCPGLSARPGRAPAATSRGPRPDPLPGSLSSLPASSPPSLPLPLLAGPFTPHLRPFSSPNIRPQPAPPRTPASPPSSPRPAALTLPGFQQHRVGHDVLDFHGRGLLPLRAAGAGAAPTASFAPSSSPATAAAPSLGSSGPRGPQHCARLFPITRCSPRHRAPPPRGRRRRAGSALPPRPWLLRPPQAAPPLRCHPSQLPGLQVPVGRARCALQTRARDGSWACWDM